MNHFGPTTPSEFYDACDKWSHDEIVVDERGRRYNLTEDGSIDFSDVSHGLLLQQDQYASRYVDGKLDGYPNFGHDLDFTDGRDGPVDSADHYRIGIFADDIPTFVGRVTAYQALSMSSLIDGETRRYPTDEERVQAAEYLKEQGFGHLFRD